MSITYPKASAALPAEKHVESAVDPPLPPILYFCDFPPSNLRGGSVLMSRLLEKVPATNLIALIGSHFDKISPQEGRLACTHLVFPATNETGRLGLGRMKSLVDWLLIPILSLYAIWVIKRYGSKVIITIAHGHFFVAAMLTAWLTRVPVVLMVHDDWASYAKTSTWVLRYFSDALFRLAARRASHVYAVTPEMKEMIEQKCGVLSEVQMPAADFDFTPGSDSRLRDNTSSGSLRIVYAGTGTGANEDSLNLLLKLVKGDLLATYGIRNWELHLYVWATTKEATQLGWNHPRVKFQGWVNQEELKRIMVSADILFLPFSFLEEQRVATSQAFPAKASDYLASGTPILILAPPYSTIVKHAKRYAFAAVVEEPSEEKLAEEVAKIWNSDDYRQLLRQNAQQTFLEHHDINKQRAALRRLLHDLVGGELVPKSAESFQHHP